jgi:starch phosphorylase
MPKIALSFVFIAGLSAGDLSGIWVGQIQRANGTTVDVSFQILQKGTVLTGKLYGDGPEMRLRQEIALGIGGWRLIDTLGLEPGACHLNEGHTAFVVLERARAAMRAHDLPFGAALAATRAGNLFTTHTSVAAGFDAFPAPLMAKYFPPGRGLLAELGLSLRDLMALGRAPGADAGEPFRPAYLAIRGAARVNAVSALHAETSKALFAPLFPRWPLAEVPITHVTNGVHVPSWDSSFTDELWTAACGPDRWRGSTEGHAESIACVDDRKLWTVRGQARRQLVEQVRVRLERQLARRGTGPETIAEAGRALDPDVLTLGIARRFAEYKRNNLLLSDEPRLRRLLMDARRPVQIVVAGKAHPDDLPSKAMVQAWVRFAADPAIRARCVFLEDYDLTLARELVQGVDVWINTPRRPWEACGTSGMKVLVNGGLNLSVLDGWWAEAFTPEVGWAISGTPDSPDGDARDASELFRILEDEVMPAFYDRDAEGVPRRWLAHVRTSLSRLTPLFSTNRMLGEYVARCYRPAEDDLSTRSANRAQVARAIDAWATRLNKNWQTLRFGRLETHETEQGIEIGIEVFFGELSPDDVAVQLYAEGEACIPMSNGGTLPGTANGFQFRSVLPRDRPANRYTPRLVPASTLAAVPQELALITWHH